MEQKAVLSRNIQSFHPRSDSPSKFLESPSLKASSCLSGNHEVKSIGLRNKFDDISEQRADLLRNINQQKKQRFFSWRGGDQKGHFVCSRVEFFFFAWKSIANLPVPRCPPSLLSTQTIKLTPTAPPPITTSSSPRRYYLLRRPTDRR